MDNAKGKTILVTGGAGYIGSHTVRQLEAAGATVVVIDNLSTGRRANLGPQSMFLKGDFADKALLDQVFGSHKIDAVMHFAASIEVGESVEKPSEYLENNTLKTARLIEAMLAHGVKKLIFSSTAAVYGLQEKVPIAEDAALEPLDPYGYSKMLSEQLIQFHAKFSGLEAIIFRYFNACGSDYDKTIYSVHESHLIPRVIRAAKGELSQLEIYGDDYDTIDGTGVRDYVHVLDVAHAHVSALNHFGAVESDVAGAKQAHCAIYNIGTSQGLSVKQIIAAVEQFSGKPVPIKIQPRRPGDSAITVADNTKIRKEIEFNLEHSDLETIIKTSWQ